MNIFQVLCFITLAHSATFHEAAEKLYVSQSSFSNNIQTIEKRLGVCLVSRGARGFSLTEAGRAFLAYAEKIVDEYDRMTDLIEEYKELEKSRVMLFADQLSSYGYNDVLIDFHNTAPDIQIELAEVGDANPMELLRRHANAVCILFSDTGDTLDGTKRHTLLCDNLTALVSDTHPIATRPELYLSDLCGDKVKIILQRHSKFLFDYVIRQCEKAGVKPDISPHTLWYSTMLEVVRELHHVAVLPGKVAGIFKPPDMKVIDIVDADPYYIDAVIAEECTHEAALRFYEFANFA